MFIPIAASVVLEEAFAPARDRPDANLIFRRSSRHLQDYATIMKGKFKNYPSFVERSTILHQRRNLKMASSAHAYVRGNTLKFYEWLAEADNRRVPQGPPVWICGDCHVGNLGPLADTDGQIDIQIRDLDQSTIGNPGHDLIRLGLSLAMAARGSDLPGVITAKMIEQLTEGYEEALAESETDIGKKPECVQVVMRRAVKRTWAELAKERIDDTTPTIPLGKSFWPLTPDERRGIDLLFATEEAGRLVTSLHCRENDAAIEVLDAAYWVKGCSSLGRLRFAVLLGIGKRLNASWGISSLRSWGKSSRRKTGLSRRRAAIMRSPSAGERCRAPVTTRTASSCGRFPWLGAIAGTASLMSIRQSAPSSFKRLPMPSSTAKRKRPSELHPFTQ